MGNQVLTASPGETRRPPSRRRFEYKRLGEVGALVVLIVIFTVLNPGAFLTLLNIRTILDQAAIPLLSVLAPRWSS